VINNLDPGKHPFHLHGHAFQVIWRSEEEAGPFADSGVSAADYAPVPMKRDTAVVRPNGNMVLRFKADNPGMSCPSYIPDLPYLPRMTRPPPFPVILTHSSPSTPHPRYYHSSE
jgi:hypothetical protein